jgi:2-dehydropantoate 2-reductase
MKNNLTVGAIGLGPVGSILSSYLLKSEVKVIAADLPHRIEQLKKNGLQVESAGKMDEDRIDVVDSARWLGAYRPDCIFIATKAGVLKKILPDVVEAAGRDCLIISAQNGIGPEDEIAKYLPPENVYRMVVNYAGGIDDKGVVHVSWINPPSFFGPVTNLENPRIHPFMQKLNAAGLHCELIDSRTIKQKAYLKTTLNAALLPLCAVMTLTMKEAMTNPITRRLAGEVMKECFAVAGRLGYDYGEGIFEQCLGYLDKGGDHHPSMTGDIRNKLPTEIDFINGKVLELGRAYEDVDLGTNRVLVSMIIAQELRNGTRKPDDIPDYLK